MRGTCLLAGLALPGIARAAEGSGVDTGALLRLTLGLAAVLVLIVGIAWGLRRTGRFAGAAGGQLRVLGAVSVGQRERVVLIQAGERQMLIGVAPGSVRTLEVLETPLVAAAEGSGREPGRGFAERLARAMRERDEAG